MDLPYIENYLINLLDDSENHIKVELKKLISKIQGYRTKEADLESMATMFSVINSYNIQYLELLDEYRFIADSTDILAKSNKAQEILSVLSCADSYIMTVLHRSSVKAALSKDNTTLYKHLMDLREKREHYKSERYEWQTILKAITTEIQRRADNLKYKRENEIK